MKHPLFESLGEEYPHALEQKYDRILKKIELLWDTPEIEHYFSELLIDMRGGRQGFSQDVLKDIMRLREFRETEYLSKAERTEDAKRQLRRLGYEPSTEVFFKALQDGNQELVDLFVRSNTNIHVRDDSDATPMLAALKRGYTVIAMILLKAGADVNTRDKLGLTPLLVACGKTAAGYKAITEALIKKGAQVNVRDRLGNTPFLLAVSGGMFDIARLLLERGAEMAATNRRGESAYSLLQQSEDPAYCDKLSRLLDAYAKPD